MGPRQTAPTMFTFGKPFGTAFAATCCMNDYDCPRKRARRWIGAVISTAVIFVLGIALAENPVEIFTQEELLSVYGFDLPED